MSSCSTTSRRPARWRLLRIPGRLAGCAGLCLLLLAAAPARAGAIASSAQAEAGRERTGQASPPRSRQGPEAEASARLAAREGGIAVLYPDLGEPYRRVFSAIIDGVEEQADVPVRRYPLWPESDVAGLQARLQRSRTRVVIALGRQGVKAVASLDHDLPVVLGGVVSMPDAESRRYSGISLTPDPAVLFSHLKGLLPGVRRVVVVYNPQHNEWLLALARAAARAQGLELVSHEARDTATAARLYQTLIAAADSHDAIWLPQDPTTVDEGTLLPLVLSDAWQHKVPVFSSSFLHVKKGALFALYPDNRQLGRALAQTASRILAGQPVAQGMVPLQAVFTAINVRTASHLGLNLDYQQQRRFDFVFPEP